MAAETDDRRQGRSRGIGRPRRRGTRRVGGRGPSRVDQLRDDPDPVGLLAILKHPFVRLGAAATKETFTPG